MKDLFKKPLVIPYIASTVIGIVFAFIFSTELDQLILSSVFICALHYYAYMTFQRISRDREQKELLLLQETNEYARQKNKEELQKRILNDDTEGDDFAALLISAGFEPPLKVIETSENIIGYFMDENIHEWVLLKCIDKPQPDKFVFHSCLHSGNPSDLPDEDKALALLGHVVYERVEPENIAS